MLQDNNYGEDLLHKIKDEKILPTPRWQFLLKNFLLWGLGGLAFLLGAIATALIFYMLDADEIKFYSQAASGILEKILLLIPFFWLVCLALFVLAVMYNVKHTKKGYRYPLFIILLAVIVGSLILGGIFYEAGLGRVVDNIFCRHAPFYNQLINPRVNFWSKPEEGRLMGIIISQIDEHKYLLMGKNERRCTVLTEKLAKEIEATIKIEQPASFLGEMESECVFKAKEILPMMPGGEFFHRFKQAPLQSSDYRTGRE